MRLLSILILSLLCISSPAILAQDIGLEFDGSGTADSFISFPDEQPPRWATGTEFTVQAIMRSNPGCGASGTCNIYLRQEQSGVGNENKMFRVKDDGSLSVLYVGSIDAIASTAAGVFPMDGSWNHVAFVHRADRTWDIMVNGTSQLSGTGNGDPIEYSSGTETIVGKGDGFQITSLMVSNVDRPVSSFAGMGPFVGDGHSILLVQFEAGAGDKVYHDYTSGYPIPMVGTINGLAYWFDGVDFDGDGINDVDEAQYGTSISDRDSDDDSIGDYAELNAPFGWNLDPANPDSDGDGIHDGCEIGNGVNAGMDSDLDLCIDGTDSNAYQYDHDRTTVTNPDDIDSDDDGIDDGAEDANFNGSKDSGETDAANPDTDSDYLFDGLEIGLDTSMVGTGTDLSVFQSDADTASTTDPLNPDTDGGSLKDGQEDLNHNGAVDGLYETDPTPPMTIDDNWDLTHYDYTWYAGQHVYVDGWSLDQGTVMLFFSTGAPGSSHNPHTDLTFNLAAPVRFPGTQTVDPNGEVRFQGKVPLGMAGVIIHMQGLEIVEEPGVGTAYRLSRNINRQIL
ncbi:MAG: hypothetical protein QGH51_02355 [Planctomycetota bacterium]|jgi:hypothetical protein|nr:hypothetical protein [Planctomycetota bacterium]